MYVEVFSIYVLGNCRTERALKYVWSHVRFMWIQMCWGIVLSDSLFPPLKKDMGKSLYSHASIYKHHKNLSNLSQFFFYYYYYYFKPFREEKEPNLSLAPLTSGKGFGRMFVFHQEEETMNLNNKNNQYHIQITYGRTVVIVCLSTPLPYIIAVWLQFKN